MLRRSPMKRTRMKTSRPTVSAEERECRATVARRSEGLCEARLPGCLGQATDKAHRRKRGMGGRPRHDDWRASNVLDECRVCHRWQHDNPNEAYDLGLALREHQNPALEPVAYCSSGFVLLDDLGYLMPVGDAA